MAEVPYRLEGLLERERVSAGRVVMWRGRGGQKWPAVVTQVHSADVVNCFVFPDGSAGLAGGSMTSVVYSDEPDEGTWCWPSRASVPVDPGDVAQAEGGS